MITIIHGEDTGKSRNSFFELRNKAQSSLTFDGNKVQMSDLVQIMEGSSLFDNHKDIFIEDFFAKRKGKDFEDIISYIQKNKDTLNVYFWEGKDISAKNLAFFKGAILQHYKYPQVLFAFLDSLAPGNLSAIKLFHQTLESSEPELVFFMLIRHFRILLALSEPSTDTIDEVKRLSPWQMPKYQKQVRLFEKDKLKLVYKKLLKIDLDQKTGESAYTLTQAIDFFLTDL